MIYSALALKYKLDRGPKQIVRTTTMPTTIETKSTTLWKDSTRNGSTIQFVSSWGRLEKEEPQTFRILKQKEGFETEDTDYKYKVGMSKYGLWLSRKKKPIFIPQLLLL